MRSPSSLTTCSRRRACRSAPPFSTSAKWSNTARPRKSSPIRASSAPRITSPAAMADRSRQMQQASSHTLKAFDEDIDRLRALISQMGGLAEHAISEAMRCLVQRDVDGAEQVIRDDKKLDALEVETERRAVQLIALRAPMAGDLRDVVAALKISGVVERIGDYGKNIAKRVPLLESANKIEPMSLLPEMARIATGMVHDVLDAFVQRDAEVALQVCERDDAVDDFYDSIFRTLLTHMMENPQHIGHSAHLLFVAKNLERVGDHATNIAEMVYYAATGGHLADKQK